MPFTPAHAAAALPLLKARLVPSALVIGTMAPDFEYFLRFAPGGGFSHTIPGAFFLSLPLALIVLWIFHGLVKEPQVQLFPDALRLRIQSCAAPFRFGGPARFALIIVSALTGIATHILWDSFTHQWTVPARSFPWLRQRMDVPFLGSLAHYSVLQLLSSAIGILLLAAWLVRWYRRTAPAPQDQFPRIPAFRRYLVLAYISAVAIAGGIIRGMVVIGVPGLHRKWEHALSDGVTTLIALAWWVLLLYAALFSRRRMRSED